MPTPSINLMLKRTAGYISERPIIFLGSGLVLFSAINIFVVVHSRNTGPAASAPEARTCRQVTGRCPHTLTRGILERSVRGSAAFILRSQQPDGSFLYEFDPAAGRYTGRKNETGSADAFYSLVFINRLRPSPGTQRAVTNAVTFYHTRMKKGSSGRAWFVPPEGHNGRTTAAAYLALALIEYLRTPGPADNPLRTDAARDCDGLISLLLSLRNDSGRFYPNYAAKDGAGYGRGSSAADGAALLALVRAARSTGRDDLIPIIETTAETLLRVDVTEALQEDPDSKRTRAFFRSGILAFYEFAIGDRAGNRRYARAVFTLADWMITTHCLLERGGNTAYAFEGIVRAWTLARVKKVLSSTGRYRCVCEIGLSRLMSWQADGPVFSRYFHANPVQAPRARGGTLHRFNSPLMRVDDAGQQARALLMAIHYMYTGLKD